MVTIYSQSKHTIINAARISTLAIVGNTIVANVVDEELNFTIGKYESEADCKKVMDWLAISLADAKDSKPLVMPAAEIVANLNLRPIAEKIIKQAEKLKEDKKKYSVRLSPEFEEHLKRFKEGGDGQ